MLRGMAFVLVIPSLLSGAEPARKLKERRFQFTYQFTIHGIPQGEKARVWVPLPTSSSEQQVKLLRTSHKGRRGTDKAYGNSMLYFEESGNKKGDLTVSLQYEVHRYEVRGASGEKREPLSLYLKPNRKVPLNGKPISLLKSVKLPEDPMEKAKALYDIVHSHMTYDKTGIGWGQGDASWACESGRGNCTDFHSLFIALARSRKIPARFEIGFPLPAKRGKGTIGGYHCWANFFISGKGWLPVDISEADKHPEMKEYYFGNLTENRVAFTQGRDLVLSPPQKGKPLNFFIYPYAEIEGKPWPFSKMTKQFTFQDLPIQK